MKMMGLIPNKKQWKSWSLPSKLTLIGTLAGLFSLGFYVIEKGYSFIENTSFFTFTNEVLLEVELVNKTNVSRTFYNRGEVFYWYPGSAQYTSSAFEVVQDGNLLPNLTIPANAKVRIHTRLLPQEVALGYLKQGHMTASLMFKDTGGIALMSDSVGFSEANISGGYLEVLLGE
ncbi:TPA: hypothetical protein N2909_002618 [Vibrio parahaemolyticus]|nr:hypothetical protein [Vibrio parahaemolyticus]